MTSFEGDDDAVTFQRQVSTVTLPPGRLTASDLLAEGQRARRRRRGRSVAASVGALVLTAGVVVGIGAYLPGGGGAATPPAVGAGPLTPSPTASAAPRPCTVERLPLPRGAVDGAVNAGSPNGRYLAGFIRTRTVPGTPAWWDGSRVQRIPISGLGEAMGVNDSGVVVGDSGSGAWTYANGKLTMLPLPKGYTSGEATAINNRGQVAGVLLGGGRVAAVVWHGTGANARVEVLKAPKGGAMAFGISESGIVVGRLDEGGLYRWDAEGRGSRLASPQGSTDGHVTGAGGEWAYGAADASGGDGAGPDPQLTQQSGGVLIQGDRRTATLWDLRTGAASVVGDGQVGAVNQRGQLVVNGPDNTMVLRQPDGSQRELALPDGPSRYAYSLSDDGTRIGGTSEDQPVRWTCPT
ncbi:hypothetical protein [Plantactinospora soyae]|uniref:HAF repeat-containing protein n=1 Tax=Plantactinospora soyae TaxID=1544732 RepID=A0A927QYC5_9ACTN|nr:hypothetical protein [Plantactinospora soyae]MBE1487712.1 hypothetical protein [Plantactinospora soyae]